MLMITSHVEGIYTHTRNQGKLLSSSINLVIEFTRGDPSCVSYLGKEPSLVDMKVSPTHATRLDLDLKVKKSVARCSVELRLGESCGAVVTRTSFSRMSGRGTSAME